MLFVGSVASQQHAIVSWGRIRSDSCACCHTEIEIADQTFYTGIEVADQTFYPIQSQYADTGPNSPSTDPMLSGAWQGSHWSTNF